MNAFRFPHGGAIDITFVEHPARVSCGTALALREFAPSYRRATIMQAALAIVEKKRAGAE